MDQTAVVGWAALPLLALGTALVLVALPSGRSRRPKLRWRSLLMGAVLLAGGLSGEARIIIGAYLLLAVVVVIRLTKPIYWHRP